MVARADKLLRRGDKAERAALPPAAAAFVADVGHMVRRGRAKRGITRRQLSADSGLSERYLAQIEGGTGNPSVIVLKAIAEAMDIPVIDLIPRSAARAPALSDILDLLAGAPASELAPIAELIRSLLNGSSASERGRRIALVGLRGAGKSTLGRALAEQLGCPFVELNRVVEQDYGASVPLLIEMSGLNTFRRYERACLERVIGEHDEAVIATAGGIVANADTYTMLLRRTHTVWIKATPAEHMSRVIEQGDFRPMAQNREAMSDLVAILEARSDDYARAGAVLDTSGESLAQSLAKLTRLVAPYVEGKRTVARRRKKR